MSASPPPRRTVLQILPSLETGGAERTAVDVAAALVMAGHRAIVASEGGRMVAELEAAGAEHLVFPAATKNPLAMALNIGRLAAIVRRESVDLLHARSRAPAWVALAAARRTGVPFVTTYHGAYRAGSRPKVLYNSVMARGDAVIANSAWTAGEIAAHYPFAASRIVTIARGSDLSAFAPGGVSPERRAAVAVQFGLAPEDGRPVLLHLARLTGWKGQRVLIDAAAALAAEGRDLVTILAGDAQGRDGYVDDLRGRIAAAGLGERVRLVGHCGDVPAALSLATVAVVPSTEPEAFGRVAVEAQAAGVPVVASDHGAAAETVLAPPTTPAERRTGWRVPPGDAGSLARAVAEALTLDPAERLALADRARTHVAGAYGVATMTAATLAVYERVLAGRTG
ncbi:glycosyltransferase family 4 protein [Pseudoxanthobacter sp. M-2]|uniref:glycosyltransferase family 4 protein n=1 Tax=Pseudoxanthobacter sp. M-2 TaxID=3078754 RepID=UPI0038FBE6AE